MVVGLPAIYGLLPSFRRPGVEIDVPQHIFGVAAGVFEVAYDLARLLVDDRFTVFKPCILLDQVRDHLRTLVLAQIVLLNLGGILDVFRKQFLLIGSGNTCSLSIPLQEVVQSLRLLLLQIVLDRPWGGAGISGDRSKDEQRQ